MIASPTFVNGLVFAIGFDGTVRKVVDLTNATPQIVGTNVDGSLALVRTSGTLSIVDLNGVSTTIGTLVSAPALDGWITPDNDAYLIEQNGGNIQFSRYHAGVRTGILGQSSNDLIGIFAIPTIDYSGAWTILRGTGHPTVLSKHTNSAGLVEQWSDITAPEVEALHAGASGSTVPAEVCGGVGAPSWSPVVVVAAVGTASSWHDGQPLRRHSCRSACGEEERACEEVGRQADPGHLRDAEPGASSGLEGRPGEARRVRSDGSG